MCARYQMTSYELNSPCLELPTKIIFIAKYFFGTTTKAHYIFSCTSVACAESDTGAEHINIRISDTHSERQVFQRQM